MDQTPNKAVLGGVGCSAFEMQKPKKISSLKGGGGGGGGGGDNRQKNWCVKGGSHKLY